AERGRCMSTIAPAGRLAAATSPDVPTLPIYRLSVAQYHAMIQHGILGPEDRVELIHGWLVPKMTKNPPHTVSTGLVLDALNRAAPLGWHVRVQEPVTFAVSEPEPDNVLARGARRDYASRHPGPAEVGLVVEVADTSLDYDRDVKKPLYASAGVPVYWIVNLV